MIQYNSIVHQYDVNRKNGDIMIKPNDAVFLTDLYEFTMAYTYFKQNRHEEIVYFDMFTRKYQTKVVILFLMA
ncbi:nicotinate phosphoribosyltransferase [Erysipelothrix rhusiopathiae SY1027]|nr:nicotinate phosphoribosyltransferase [Erysipelothrix rhusiopathiae SY1027]